MLKAGTFLFVNQKFSSNASLAYKYILSISGWWSIKLSNEFVFPDPEPPILKILYVLYLACYLFTESIDCILLSSIAITAILLTSSVKTLCLSLLNLQCFFNTNLLLFMNSLQFFSKNFCINIMFYQLLYFIFQLSCF